MKNYLFAPFKNDDDKIEEFNAVVNALNYVVDAEETHHHESALHGLRVFIGRLESYYDATICHLKAEFKDYSKRAREHHECGEEYERELKAEIKELKAKLNELQDERNTLKYALENKECGCGNQ